MNESDEILSEIASLENTMITIQSSTNAEILELANMIVDLKEDIEQIKEGLFIIDKPREDIQALKEAYKKYKFVRQLILEGK